MINKNYFEETNTMLNEILNNAYKKTRDSEFIFRQQEIDKKNSTLIKFNELTEDFATH